MHNYRYVKSEPGLWTVGFTKPDGSWEPESDHGAPEAASARVNWLNGDGDEWVYIRSEPGLLTVGYYDGNGHWQPESDHGDPEDAARRVAELNQE